MTAFYQMIDRSPPLPADLIERLSSVDTATIGHVEHLGFVGGDIRPVFPARVAGAAFTVAAPGRDGVIIYKAIDLLLPGDILVISRVDRDDIACVGGGVAAAAKAKGAAGIVIDGPCTDVDEIIATGVPVWCRGVSAKTTNRQFQIGGSLNVPIACGAVAVLPGYGVLADNEGVFVADRNRLRILADAALERQKRSVAVRSHLASGRSIFDFDEEPRS
ncbi:MULTISPECIES: RraA family protein [Rhizobium]|jgi:regulator of RNase E activity RraA|uniref:Putative 4-hydroxy-4-methyl-2-oxoglutarate aldolase n=1 Tax=Rhizobium leguminosarum bv. trifolii (strain WSM1325) TaxID=395491 RepID=C6B8T1_RHILS|nr:demethylmenaquinone methyltransferase [Rhizobium leguminosarum]ACS60319.1 demethylmenaquinone methyltransferase protein [Rhizobium leguminosarum bv. trifolii WSM1325]MBY2919391.1 RraA family protein [Rhizobium leguminosarum]MBY2926214.1 RraA family protein [Rhizobium leguminosarum]MBY2936089.1 RraA family protein [Rhizobium leguminosarum]MBY2951697.1 RraA family protein [Rhizobium leguminosarum]